jgi:para-nitrobenzyl esterase
MQGSRFDVAPGHGPQTNGEEMRGKILALAVGVSLLAANAALAQDAPDLVALKDGALKGVVAGDVVSFKDIPFAAPPVGDLRWKAPQPEAPWTGVRAADAYGPTCLQVSGGFGGRGGVQNEDCLYLNVFEPVTHHMGGKLPVMVWIYGGGFIGGAANYYNGTSFAHDGVVLVTLNYRLGRLGWFAHPGLTREAAGGPTGDFGLMDQIAALKWVKANIGAFGGDAHNVTIFGESAGAMSVNYLLISPEARGLFNKAISESGFGRTPGRPLALAEQQGAAFAQSSGATGDDAAQVAALRAMPADVLMKPTAGLDAPDAPGPIIDGVLVPETVDKAFAEGKQAHVPFILGANSYEASLFGRTREHPEIVLDPLGDKKDGAVKLFGDGDPAAAASLMWTENAIVEPDRYLARQEDKAGNKAYVYYFSYVPAAIRATAPGVNHGGEIAYVFKILSPVEIKRGPYTIPAATPEDQAMADHIHAYWVAFAKTGEPDSAGGPRWPAYTPENDAALDFSVDGVVVRDHFKKQQLDIIEAMRTK